jgi:hypothetical protein
MSGRELTEWVMWRPGREASERRGQVSKWFENQRLAALPSSWKMHLLFTPRVLSFYGAWRKVRNVAGREDRSLASGDEQNDPRSFYVRAQSNAVENPAGVSTSRWNSKENFAECEDIGYSRVSERTEDASLQSSQAALQIAETGRGACATKGLRCTPRRTPPKNAALTHHRSRREVAAPASGP